MTAPGEISLALLKYSVFLGFLAITGGVANPRFA
jgi:hypothetical protein